MRSIGLLAVGVLFGHAQEFDPHDPAIIAAGLKRADAIVVGKFGVDRCWPWFDGWHCSGAIRVEESLFGDRKPLDAVPFHWKERYGANCFVCDQVSRLHGDRGIWFLTIPRRMAPGSSLDHWQSGAAARFRWTAEVP
jgi:hypothetical protein